MCLINTHIMIYWHVRHNCKLWQVHRFYCFFMEFSYIIDDHSCLKYIFSTKLSQIVCLINLKLLVCQHDKCDCWLWKVNWFNRFVFGNFHILLHVWNVIISTNFYNLCLEAEVLRWIVNLCNHLWFFQSSVRVFLLYNIYW